MKPGPALPIHEILPEIEQRLLVHNRLVLEAPPGAGKTTQVPLALLRQPWCADKRILLLEPRRLAARAAAGFMAAQLGEEVGATVGYRIRFENRISAQTRIEVVTEGILTRMLQDDPLLDGVAAILFDEFHERHLSGDLGLALALDVQTQLRPDLRLVLMSATLDGERLAHFLDAQRLSSAGRSFPVTMAWFPARREEALVMQVRRCIEQALQQHPGDLLIFLPGQREIGQVEQALQNLQLDSTECLALYGEMSLELQRAVLRPAADGTRRIVLATNIAESSLTLPGVRVVIDSGLAREPRFDPNSGFSRLQTVHVSQASADQRSGRAGRTSAGWCYRLWPQSQRLDASRSPEILNVDLAGLALELAAWGSAQLRFVDPPPPGNMAAARDLLKLLGALDQTGLVIPLGHRMLALGTHPRLAAMLLQPQEPVAQALACDLAALIEARDPLQHYRGDDWHSRYAALVAFRNKGQRKTRSEDARGEQSHVSAATLMAISTAADQWRRRLQLAPQLSAAMSAADAGEFLLHAWPDRIARVHPRDRQRYQLSNGRTARLSEDSRLFGAQWLVITELRHESRDSLVLRGAPVDEQHLRQEFPQRFTEQNLVRWDEASRSLVARRETRFDEILLDSKPAGRPDPAQAATALCEAVGTYGLAALPWSEGLQQWRQRVLCLRQWMPELGLPDLSDQVLLNTRAQWLLPAFARLTRLDALTETAFAAALKTHLDWQQGQLLDTHAPVRIHVPSGLERPIQYSANEPPVLAVKLQELFGLADTPRIAGGRISLTLHLLSPGGKPLQITRDLKSFWERTYPEVKKEMKGRYPRHPWPDDPWQAVATHRAKPRGT